MSLENHTGGAEPALKGVVLDKGFLEGVKLPVPGQAFNRLDALFRDGTDGHLTRGNRLFVYKDRTGAA